MYDEKRGVFSGLSEIFGSPTKKISPLEQLYAVIVADDSDTPPEPASSTEPKPPNGSEPEPPDAKARRRWDQIAKEEQAVLEALDRRWTDELVARLTTMLVDLLGLDWHTASPKMKKQAVIWRGVLKKYDVLGADGVSHPQRWASEFVDVLYVEMVARKELDRVVEYLDRRDLMRSSVATARSVNSIAANVKRALVVAAVLLLSGAGAAASILLGWL